MGYLNKFLIILSLVASLSHTEPLAKYEALGYHASDIEFLKELYQDELPEILKHGIYRDDLFTYLRYDNLPLQEIIASEKLRKRNRLSHLAAINTLHHPNIMNGSYLEARPALNQDSLLILVNKNYRLDETFIPGDLVYMQDVKQLVDDKNRYYLKTAAYKALLEFLDEARKHGYTYYVSSGYRDYRKQERIYNEYRSHGADADMFSARPGHSEHQTGLALDITCKSADYELSIKFAYTAEGKFLKENASRFGFIERYPLAKENLTGYQYEPWHLRYVGKDAAEIIHMNNLTLEEYLVKYTYLK